MGQYYNCECTFKYDEGANLASLENWLESIIEGVSFQENSFICWGDNSYNFEDEILEQMKAVGTIISAELDIFGSDTDYNGGNRYIWNPEKNDWDAPISGKICFNTDEAEVEFGKSTSHRALEASIDQIIDKYQTESDIEDIKSLRDEIPEAYTLTQEDMINIQHEFRDNHDWTLPDYDQLKCHIEMYLEEKHRVI